ncbi:hypothetical protein ACT6QG_09120 [Xanthobacter sp. TB0136]|uniref:hypothetical protein n=1 Tax=Xanthobacter sp. TB0136 TaxID=3459177 RepID=UPI004039F312
MRASLNMGDDGADLVRSAADSEKDARALALIARTLRELTAAEDEAIRTHAATGEDDHVRDLDEFRRELAHRLERLCAGGGAGPALSGEPE